LLGVSIIFTFSDTERISGIVDCTGSIDTVNGAIMKGAIHIVGVDIYVSPGFPPDKDMHPHRSGDAYASSEVVGATYTQLAPRLIEASQANRPGWAIG
jgi:hypothetical protein